MRDEIDSRIWVEHGAQFSTFVADVIAALRQSFERLHEIEFDAPWRSNLGGR